MEKIKTRIVAGLCAVAGVTGIGLLVYGDQETGKYDIFNGYCGAWGGLNEGRPTITITAPSREEPYKVLGNQKVRIVHGETYHWKIRERRWFEDEVISATPVSQNK